MRAPHADALFCVGRAVIVRAGVAAGGFRVGLTDPERAEEPSPELLTSRYAAEQRVLNGRSPGKFFREVLDRMGESVLISLLYEAAIAAPSGM